MSRQTNDASKAAAVAAPQGTAGVVPIALPAGYQLRAWQVRNGASVRIGEIVAIAVLKQQQHHQQPSQTVTGGATMKEDAALVHVIAAAPSVQLYKRPKLRRRPTVGTATDATGAVAGVAAAACSTGDGDDDRKPAAIRSGDPTSTPSNPSTSLQQILSKMTTTTASTATTRASEIASDGSRNAGEVTSKHQQPKQISIQSPMDGIVRIRDDSSSNAITSSEHVIGTIEPCPHPTIIEGLCAVCGNAPPVSGGSNRNGSTTASGNTTSSQHQHDTAAPFTDRRVTVAGFTVTVSEAESQRMAAQDAARLHGDKKLSLVLDLDHTLVHATADPRAKLLLEQRDDVRTLVLPVVLWNGASTPAVQAGALKQQPPQQQQQQPRVLYQHHYIKLRPHVTEFMQSLQDGYELGVYTAGTRDYAEQICRLLARHVLQTPCDDVSLHQLRHQVGWLQHQWEQQQQQQSGQEEKKETPAIRVVDGRNENEQDTTEVSASVADNEVSTGKISDSSRNAHDGGKVLLHDAATPTEEKKRKRVNFDAATLANESIRSNKSNGIRIEPITQSHLDAARAQLAEAERLEQAAMELRQKWFGSRVCSRTDAGDLGTHVKSLRRIFPCGGAMAAVVDDREDVWANGDALAGATTSTRRGEPPDNLLLVRPYHWSSFEGFADVNNAAGADLALTTAAAATSTNGNAAPVEKDHQLLATAEILKRLHQRYYCQTPPGKLRVPEILQKMRLDVLAGCELVLSGLVPLHRQQQQQQQEQSNSQVRPRPPFIRYAESLGATVATNVSASTTHVVAAKDGTDKIWQARTMPHCHVVQAAWLVDCFRTLTRCDEHRYPLAGAAVGGSLRPPRVAPTSLGNSEAVADLVQPLVDSTRENNVSTSSNNSNSTAGDDEEEDDDDDDDDFAAELEHSMMGLQDEGASLS